MFDLDYKDNEIVSHMDVCRKTKCGVMGGIRYSKENNILVLISKKNGIYENGWNNNIYEYMGCGAGNQSVDYRSNKRLANSNKTDTPIFLFEWVNTSSLIFIGKMVLDSVPVYKTVKNAIGEDETKIIFPLKRM